MCCVHLALARNLCSRLSAAVLRRRKLEALVSLHKREQQQERYVTLATEAVSKAQQDVIDERHVIDQLLALVRRARGVSVVCAQLATI